MMLNLMDFRTVLHAKIIAFQKYFSTQYFYPKIFAKPTQGLAKFCIYQVVRYFDTN